MCCDLGTPCALRALAKPLATTPSTHAMPRPLRGGSKGQNLRARPEHPPIHALWGGRGSGSNCNRSTGAPSTHHVKGGQGSRVNLSICLRTLWGNTCHRVVHVYVQLYTYLDGSNNKGPPANNCAVNACLLVCILCCTSDEMRGTYIDT